MVGVEMVVLLGLESPNQRVLHFIYLILYENVVVIFIWCAICVY